jgi:hypothetical protein
MGAAAGFSIETDRFRSSMADLFFAISEGAKEAVTLAAKAAERRAQQTTLFKDRTGVLRKSIQGSATTETRGGFRSKVRAGVGVKYARPVHDGSVPHVIAARKPGGFLKFVSQGKLVFRRYVIHPGTDARPFITRAGESTRSVLEHQARKLLDMAVEAFNRA